MKVFVAGATGALGRPLVKQLVERGHEVTGMTRSESKTELLRELGAKPGGRGRPRPGRRSRGPWPRPTRT